MSAETAQIGPERTYLGSLLQWGRTSMSAETRQEPQAGTDERDASMGPHFNECGNWNNGKEKTDASKELQWGRTSMSAETTCRADARLVACPASMGPHFNECGNFSRPRT